MFIDQNNPKYAWHFLNNDRRLNYCPDCDEDEDCRSPHTLVEVGQTLHEEEIGLCSHGLHWSEKALDGLDYAHGSVICRVAVWGETDTDGNKGVSQYRKVLWMADVTALLHEFACDVAEEALTMAKCQDQHSWKAIAVKRAWVKGEATDDQLAAARSAAERAADWAAERAADWAAGWAAGWAAERVAGWAAGWTAGWAAERAARAAAERVAGWAAERAAQNKRLERMLFTAMQIDGYTGEGYTPCRCAVEAATGKILACSNCE